jgi:putative pyruvate formate lyase activating enzyme
MQNHLSACRLCPRDCGVNRLENQLGFCQAGKQIRLARAALHFWEEPCLSGTHGSGTVFFSGCNLRCIYCQNANLSHKNFGKEISTKRLAEIFLELQAQKAHNINLVTPTPYIWQIIEAIKLAKQKGLIIPIVYNSGSYEKPESIKLLKDHIDIYLPDLKYFSPELSQRYSAAPDYFSFASQSIKEMYFQVGEPVFSQAGILQKGVIIRHLILPSCIHDPKKIIDFVSETFGSSVLFSLMNQYTPFHNSAKFPELQKPLDPQTYAELITYAEEKGLKLYTQAAGTDSESFIPPFDLTGV